MGWLVAIALAGALSVSLVFNITSGSKLIAKIEELIQEARSKM